MDVMNDGRDLITAEEAAGIIGISVNNLRQKVHLKLIHPVTRKGRRVFFDRMDAVRLRDDRAAKKPTPVTEVVSPAPWGGV